MSGVRSHSRRQPAGFCAALLLAVAAPASAQLSLYSQNFDGLVHSDTGALANDGWRVFGNVFDGGGSFKSGYGVFPAPNDGDAFSKIIDGQGGAAQGSQQLKVFNDYNCCEPDDGHLNGTDLVESNVFQEQTIGAADVGTTWTLRYDAKRGEICCGTTAIAFIKTLDPNAGFALTNFITNDTTNLPAGWATYEISLVIDAGLVGQILQFGFASTASNNADSSNYYDNISFDTPAPDTDGDGVPDNEDNCTEVANADQRDTNGDGIGNRCDPDLNDNCSVNVLDLGILKSRFFTNDPDADLDGDGAVNVVDLYILKSYLFSAPGPSGVGSACS